MDEGEFAQREKRTFKNRLQKLQHYFMKYK